VTPLQMVAGVSAIAAGGVYHQPRVVARVVARDGSIETLPVQEDRRVMSAEAARTMVAIMRGVTEQGGTAKQAAIAGYPVAGKTGTAQKVANGRYDPSKFVSSFVGFAPARRPKLLVAVMVDEPQGDIYGGEVAAPAWKEITSFALNYLRIPPG
jgi:cell division protein FtsI/penicillin-binding protein 2